MEAGAQYIKLSGIAAGEPQHGRMGVYRRVEGRHTECGRGVYQQEFDGAGEAASAGWMWFHNGDWAVSDAEKDVGTNRCVLHVTSDAVVPEESAGEWKASDGKNWIVTIVSVSALSEAEHDALLRVAEERRAEVCTRALGKLYE